jgi:hypothetical protein
MLYFQRNPHSVQQTGHTVLMIAVYLLLIVRFVALNTVQVLFVLK